MKNDRGATDHVEALVKRMKSTTSPFRETLRTIYREVEEIKDGAVADYIPELTRADPEWFGLCVVTTEGHVFEIGDSKQTFTIQSCSKPFIYGLALEDNGRDYVLSRVGVEPSGDAFNAIVLDEQSNRPFNPMVNAGAIATTDMIKGADLPNRLNRMLAMFARHVGHPVQVDSSVFLSERTTGHRNRAVANLMLNFGMVSDVVDQSLELYFQQCSVLVSALDLAMMGATLASGGRNPVSGEQALSAEYVKDILCMMYTCGMYDFAGEWAHKVGLPAKSGVGGGIIAVVPGMMGIGVYSPRLDAKGTSARGLKVCQALSEKLNLHVFESVGLRPSLDQLVEKPARASSSVSEAT